MGWRGRYLGGENVTEARPVLVFPFVSDALSSVCESHHITQQQQ